MNWNLNEKAAGAVGVILLWLPKLLSALLILIIGGFLAGLIRTIVTKALRAAKFDHLLDTSPVGDILSRLTSSPARVVGTVVYWLLYLGVVSLAVAVLGIPALTAFMAAVYAYLPNVFAAIAIFMVAAAVSAGVAAAAVKFLGDTPTGKMIASILPTLTMVIAIFMILDQLKIAREIVTITYAGLIATMVLGIGLSFGLGGREVASDLLGEAYQKGKAGSVRAKHDLHTGHARVQDKLDDLG